MPGGSGTSSSGLLASVRSPLSLFVAVCLAITATLVWAHRAPAAEAALSACPTSGPISTLTGTLSQQVRNSSPAAGTIFDARLATMTAYPFNSLYPFTFGASTAPPGLCVVGGTVVGQQSRTLTWDEMKNSYDGDGLRIASNAPYVVDGVRVDNVEDGIAPRGTPDLYPKDGDGFTLRNVYTTYIRDDCVENDDIAGGVIYDSLFDGCNTGISERPSDGNPQNNYPAPAGETITLDNVLLRLQALPGPRGSHDPNVLGHGQLFKWSPVANRAVIRNSIFLVERFPEATSYFPFPPGTTTENVTIVWLGGGSFGWSVPAGTTVTTDRAVWDSARAVWLQRHGCTSFAVCTRLHTPDPIGSPTPVPSPSPTVSPIPLPTRSPTLSPSPTPSPTPAPIGKKKPRGKRSTSRGMGRR